MDQSIRQESAKGAVGFFWLFCRNRNWVRAVAVEAFRSFWLEDSFLVLLRLNSR